MWEIFCLRWRGKSYFFISFLLAEWLQCSNPWSLLQRGSPGSSFTGQHSVLFPAPRCDLLISFCWRWCLCWAPSAQEGWTSAELPVRPADVILLEMMCVLSSKCPRRLNISWVSCPLLLPQLAVPRPYAGQQSAAGTPPLQRKGWKFCVLFCSILFLAN